MTAISNSYLLNYRIRHPREESGIHQKIYHIGKRIFSYLCSHQTALTALAAVIWSYKFIEVVTASELVTTAGVYDLESCQDMVCHHWNNSMEARENFSPIIRFRCNSSHQYYYPFSFLDKCMHTLCEHMTSIGRYLPECFQYSSDPLPPHSLGTLWKEVCPNNPNMTWPSRKRTKYMVNCLKNLCNYYDTFNINTDPRLGEWCFNRNIEKLQKSLKNLYKKLMRSEITTEEWTQNSLLAALIQAVDNILSGISSMLSTIVTFEISMDRMSIEDNISPLRDGLKKILFAASEGIKDLASTEGEKLSKRLVNSLLEISDNLNNLFSYQEGITQEELATKSFDIDNITIDSQNESDFVPVPYERNVTESLLSLYNEYLNDYSFPSLLSGLASIRKKQLMRFILSITKWVSAYCFYHFPSTLFCRLPITFATQKVDAAYPYLQKFSQGKGLNLLCHVLDRDVWCDFEKLLSLVCYKRNSSITAHCRWDHMLLELERNSDNIYKINLIGDCFRETFIFKPC